MMTTDCQDEICSHQSCRDLPRYCRHEMVTPVLSLLATTRFTTTLTSNFFLSKSIKHVKPFITRTLTIFLRALHRCRGVSWAEMQNPAGRLPRARLRLGLGGATTRQGSQLICFLMVLYLPSHILRSKLDSFTSADHVICSGLNDGELN